MRPITIASVILSITIVTGTACKTGSLQANAQNSSAKSANSAHPSTEIHDAQIDPRSQTPAKGGGKTGLAGSTPPNCTESGSGEESILQCPDPAAPPPLEDDGWGRCDSSSHFHDLWTDIPPEKRWYLPAFLPPGETTTHYFDGRCHDNFSDLPMDTARPTLPKPKFHPKPHFHPNPNDRWL